MIYTKCQSHSCTTIFIKFSNPRKSFFIAKEYCWIAAPAVLFFYFAIPKNKAKHRSICTSASASMCPNAGPTLSRLTVMILSTITCEGFFRPFLEFGWSVILSKGASTRVLVIGNTVTLVGSKKGQSHF